MQEKIAMTPQVGKEKVLYIKSFLKERSKYGPVSVLEWGSGGSTVYFSKWLQEEGIDYEWVSLEYDSEWYEVVINNICDERTKVVLFEANGNPKSRDVPMDDYVSYPKTLNKKFDLVFIDGRKRRRCTLEAKDLVKKDGIVLVHDAWRTRYQCAFKEYPDSKFLDRSLWQGRLRTTGFFERIKNSIVNNCYITRGRFRIFRKRYLSRFVKW